MRDIAKHAITDAVIARMANAQTARTRQISEALVRHLHAFVSEVEPSAEEWAAGIDFLTRVGRACTEQRQEFILLSDVLGVTMLIDVLQNDGGNHQTESTVLGPFFVENAKPLPLGADLAEGHDGRKLFVSGTVSDGEGRVLPGATIDVWHSGADGFYDVQKHEGPFMRGRLRTDAAGRFWFWTIAPCSYPVPHDGPAGAMLEAQGRHPFRPAHVHFRIEAEGHKPLVTQVYAAGDPYLDSDAVFGVKSSLIRDYVEQPAGTAPDGRRMDDPYRRLDYDFVLAQALVPA